MIYWADYPTNQWIYVINESGHTHPWAVVIGGYVRARCTTEAEARMLESSISDTFKRLTNSFKDARYD